MGSSAPAPTGSEKETEKEAEMRKLHFRNYNPRTDSLQKYCEEQPACEALLLKVEEEQAAALAAANAKFGDEALDTENMVPKKGNWDLKRVLAPKLELLEKRTQRAILEIARARLATSGATGEGLARAVAEARIESSDEDIP